jgi:hypothetical protein
MSDQPCGGFTHTFTRSQPRQAMNTRTMAGQLKTLDPPQRAITQSLPGLRHKHIILVARDPEVLAGEDPSTTIDTVDGDIPTIADPAE